MRIVIEIGNVKDAQLLVSVVKRLYGKIITETGEDVPEKGSKTFDPVSALENIAKRGGISSIQDPDKWQREQRNDRNIGQ